ncbi:MAG: hypothetical protein AMS21_09340 [Gemmatimonas sp. SG8_38_2]|nr:MAG: hypothetical protein AMS21_09340 [Gemmatimonas sp. SG8_38_2]
MLKSASIVVPVALLVLAGGIAALQLRLPIGPVVLALGLLPLSVMLAAGRRLSAAVPDLVFGCIDTGLLAIPALFGGIVFGIPGAIAGGVIGDSITDGVAGFFEGYIAERLRSRGFEESREAVTTSLGKMSGCLLGSGAVLSLAFLAGISPTLL